MIIPLLAPPYEVSSRAQSKARLVNWYLVDNPTDDEYPFVAYPTPGAKVFSTNVTGSVVRGLYKHKNVLYGVIDNKFYSFNTAGTATELGTLDTSWSRISFASIEDELLFVDGVEGYHYKISTSTFQKIGDADFPVADRVTAQDGRFIVPQNDDDSFFLSDANDGLTWQATQTATKTGTSDDIMTIESHKRYLWILGEYASEIWFNSGDVDFTFERQNGIFISYGSAAKHGVAEAANSLFWLGRNRHGDVVVLQSVGLEVKIISTRSINHQLNTYDTVADAFAYSYTQEGHEFVVWSFPTAKKTWVFDLSTQLWHERESYDGTNTGSHIGNCYAYFDNKHIIGDKASGTLYSLDLDTYTDNSNHIRRLLVSNNIDIDTRRGSLYGLQIRVEPGVGLTAGQGSDPQLMIRYSKDFANTWSNEMWRSPGKKGEYRDRVLINRLGYGRTFTFEVSATDPVKWIILGARADLERSMD
jgi:hypothetical protein